MAPEKINKIYKWLAAVATVFAIIAGFFAFSDRAVDSVNFVSKTKETNIGFVELKKDFADFKQEARNGFTRIITLMHDKALVDSTRDSERERLRNEEDNKYRNSVYKVAKSCIIK